jgi:hypothetical protein
MKKAKEGRKSEKRVISGQKMGRKQGFFRFLERK